MGMWSAVGHSMPGHQHPCLSSSKNSVVSLRVAHSRPATTVLRRRCPRSVQPRLSDALDIHLWIYAAWAHRHPIPRFREEPASTAPTDAEITRIVTGAFRVVNLIFRQGFTICRWAVDTWQWTGLAQGVRVVTSVHDAHLRSGAGMTVAEPVKKPFFCNKATFPSVWL